MFLSDIQHYCRMSRVSLHNGHLVYVKPRERVQDVEPTRSRPMEERKRAIALAERLVEENKKKGALEASLKEYNKKYAKTPLFAKPKPYELPLELDLANVGASLLRVQEKVALFNTAPPKGKETDWRNQKDDLANIELQLLEQKKLIDDLERARYAKLEKHNDNLVDRGDRVEEIMAFQERLKSKEHQDLLDNYNSVFNGLMGKDPEFRRFYEKPDGTPDAYKERENQQLFFAILSHETNRFSTDFILGERFKDNYQDNKKNFPFIYHEWIKGKFDVETIDRKKKDVEKKTQIAGLASPDDSVPTIQTMWNALNADVTANPKIPTALATFKDPIDAIKRTVKDRVYYQEAQTAIGNFFDQLNSIADYLRSEPGTKKFLQKIEGVRKQLVAHRDLAEEMEKLKFYEEELDKVDKSFVRKEFSKSKEIRQMVMELAMRKFQKAMTIVDSPLSPEKGDFGPLMHSGARHQLIALVYRQGVSRYTPSGTYQESRTNEYAWLLENVVNSPYFDKNVLDPHLDSEQRELLQLGYYANRIFFRMKYLEDQSLTPLKSAPMQDLLRQLDADLKSPMPRSPDVQKRIDEAIYGVPGVKKGLQHYTPFALNETNATQIVEMTQNQLRALGDFRTQFEKLMKHPTREGIRSFIEAIKRDPSTLDPVYPSNQAMMDDYAKYAKTVDLDYNAMDLDARTEVPGGYGYLERMGIKPEGLYRAYLEYIRKNGGHEDMKYDQWDTNFRTPEGVQKLVAMFGQILPTAFKGREDFLQVFAQMKAEDFNNPESFGKGKVTAVKIYTAIKAEVKIREEMIKKTGKSHEAVEKILAGQTWGDRAEDYIRGVFDMLIGPGQSLANRASGAIIIYAAWKLLEKARKGTGTSGKIMQALALAGAADIMLHNVGGEGISDKMRLAGVAAKLGDTYESVLLERDEKRFDAEGITKNEHARALMEMRNKPFDKLMKWYESTDMAGKPIPGKEEEARIPEGINISHIISGRAEEHKESKVRLILKLAMDNFFGYVGNKEQQGGGAEDGHNILKQIWIDGVKGKKENIFFTKRGLPPILLDRWRSDSTEPTWQTVYTHEIRLEDMKKNLFQETTDYLKDKAAGIQRWNRDYIKHRLGVGAEQFWENVDARYVPAVEEFLGGMGVMMAENLRYVGRTVQVTYEGYKYEIQAVGKEHLDFVWEGIKLPFKMLYAADRFFIPRLLAKIRQTQEIIRSDELTTIDNTRTLQPAMDILDPTILARLQLPPGAPNKLYPWDLLDRVTNQNMEYFGSYQVPFYKAATNANRFYESQSLPTDEDGSPNIGYFVADVTPGPDVKPTDSPANRFAAMYKAAYEQAETLFIGKGVRAADIHKYMKKIHIISRNADVGGKPPSRLYVFFRMSMPHSSEYQLKEEGRWTDTLDPNQHKYGPPFTVDPSKSVLENLERAYGGKNALVREGLEYGTIAISQWLRLMFGAANLTGGTLQRVLGLIPGMPATPWLNFFTTRDQKTLQYIDEKFGSAGDTRSALSRFYQNQRNADTYKAALEHARKHKVDLDLTRDPHTTLPRPWVNVGGGRQNTDIYRRE